MAVPKNATGAEAGLYDEVRENLKQVLVISRDNIGLAYVVTSSRLVVGRDALHCGSTFCLYIYYLPIRAT
jgi:hypothetical protein